MAALRPWLRERLPEVLTSAPGREASERVLAHYAAAAARYYLSLPRVQDPHDRRESARRLLSGEPQLRCDSLAVARSAEDPLALEHQPGALTEAELEGLMGFAI